MGIVSGRRLVSPTLVGRAAELAQLAATLSAPPAVAVVEGEAGIGKTRLVTELAGRSGVREPQVLVGGCLRIREPFPLGPLVEVLRTFDAGLSPTGLSPVAGALRPLLPEFAHLLPEPPPSLDDRAAERHRVFRALAEVLASIGPAVLVVEDLHWADEQTVEFLRYLLRDPPPKLALVLTYRDNEAGPDVTALTARLSPAIAQLRVRLEPLAVPEAGALAAAILELDRVSEPFAQELWRRTAGLPLALEEVLALLRARGDLVRDASGEWVRLALDRLDVPTGIRDQVWQRVGRLSAPARLVVEGAAVLQVPVALPVLSGTCPPGDQTRAGIEEALAAGVLVETPAGVGLRHLLAAQAVYESIPAPRRLELHARAAAALRAGPEPALGQVAHHLRLAGELAGWVDTAEQAADQAIGLGHDDEAVRLLSDVLRHAPLPAARRGRLAVKLGRAAVDARMIHPAVIDQLASAIQQEQSPPVRGELRLLQAGLLERDGAGFPALRRLIADAEPDLTDRPALRAKAMVGLGFPLVPGVPLAEHRRWLGRVVEIVDRLPDRPHRVWLLGKVAMLRAIVGDPGWRPITERVLAETGGAPRHHQEVRAYFSIGLGACMAGDLATAARLQAVCQDGGARFDRGDRYTAQLQTGQVLLDFCRGHWSGLAGRAAQLVDQLPAQVGRRNDMELVLAWLALARGELGRAGQWFETAVPSFAQRDRYEELAIPGSGMLRLALGRGRFDQAVAGVRWLCEALGSVPFQVTSLRALPAMTEALVAGGETGEARALVHGYAAEVRGLDAPLAPAALPYARGVLAGAAGRWAPAAAYLQAAAHRYEALQCRYEAAHAYELAAPALLRADAPAAAAQSIRAALATYQRLDASWDYSRAAGTARRLGLPVPARHRGGHHGYQGDLSPRERQVAELAATGLTNPEIAGELFVSVGTVKKQLAGAMRKLGVRSRVALAARLAGELGPPGP